MDPSLWPRLREIFAAALDLDPAERDAFLVEACAGDEALLARARSLLEADDDAHSLLDAGPAAFADAFRAPEETMRIGERIGPWQLVERIGQGGMGSVYLAERVDGEFEQRVALKIIRRGMDSEEILARFRAERQILARLDHPNIARFLDGGLTDGGVPWFTMEYVDGIPIDRYCDEHDLPVDARLDLFDSVCRAVAYAQRNLVVHRDLKPSNILVTSDGVPKLLDFGIAKLLGEGRAAATPVATRTGHRVMTPGYAAPEQVRGESVTTATDVYALGVVLFELLTGQRPYAPEDDTPAALERAICESPPPRPSTVVTGPPGPDAARPAHLRRKLRGDLDNICLMALRKEPERRYGSAQLLADDVGRYRTGMPVTARADTVGYRAGKFLRRNRTGAAAATVVIVLLVSVVAFYTTQLARERDRARLEAEKARTVSEFLTGLFELADPSETLGETITARELLDRGARRVDEELREQPEIRATLLDVVGDVYYGLGMYTDADSVLGRALEQREAQHHGDHPDLAETLSAVGRLRSVQGEWAEAESLLTRALEMRTRLHGRVHPETAACLYDLSWVGSGQGRYAETEAHLREAAQIWKTLGLERDRRALLVNADLALVLNEQGKHGASEELFRATIPAQREMIGDHPDLSSTLYNFSELLRSRDQFDEAESVLAEALEIDRTVYGEDHPNVVYDLLSLGRIRKERYDLVGAETLFREVLEARRRIYGEEHPQVARSLSDLSGIRFRQGFYAEAESLLHLSIEMHERVDGPGHPVFGARHRDLGRIAQARGDHEEAVEHHRRACALRLEVWGEGAPQLAETRMYLARALADAGRLEEALQIQEDALEITLATRGPEDRETVYQMHAMGVILARVGRAKEAETYYRRALEIRMAASGPDRPAVAALQHDLGVLLGDEALLRSALVTRRARLPAGHRSTANTLLELGRLQARSGRRAEAVRTIEEALAMVRGNLGDDHPFVREAQEALAEASETG